MRSVWYGCRRTLPTHCELVGQACPHTGGYRHPSEVMEQPSLPQLHALVVAQPQSLRGALGENGDLRRMS